MKEFVSVLITIVVLALFVIFGAVAGAWMIQLYWGWYLTPLFGIAALTFKQYIGISMMLSVLAYRFQAFSGDEDNDSKKVKRLMLAISTYIVLLATGWFIQATLL